MVSTNFLFAVRILSIRGQKHFYSRVETFFSMPNKVIYCSVFCKRTSHFICKCTGIQGIDFGILSSLTRGWFWLHADHAKNAKARSCGLGSHRSHESHEEHLLSLVLSSGMCTLGKADKRGRSDAPSVRFVRSVRFVWVKTKAAIWEKTKTDNQLTSKKKQKLRVTADT